MLSIPKINLRVTLLSILALVAAVSLHFQIKANSIYKTVVETESLA